MAPKALMIIYYTELGKPYTRIDIINIISLTVVSIVVIWYLLRMKEKANNVSTSDKMQVEK